MQAKRMAGAPCRQGMTRRNFLGLGLAGGAFSLLPGAAAAFAANGVAAGSAPVRHSIYKAVVDQGLAESIAFGQTLAALKVPTATIAGDITRLWFDDLDRRWRQGPVAVSGLTAKGPLFCLEQLMGQYGLRLAFRGEHAYQADGSVLHRLEGDPGLLEVAPVLGASGPGWSRSLAALLAQAPSSGGSGAIQVSTPGAGPRQTPSPTLYSWLLVPAARA